MSAVGLCNVRAERDALDTLVEAFAIMYANANCVAYLATFTVHVHAERATGVQWNSMTKEEGQSPRVTPEYSSAPAAIDCAVCTCTPARLHACSATLLHCSKAASRLPTSAFD